MFKKMRRNCNLELRLVSPAVSLDSTDSSSQYHPMLDAFNGNPNGRQRQRQQQRQQQQQQKQLTLFYNGRMIVCDVTELQARAIILLASRKMEESSSMTPTGSSSPTSPLLQSQLQSPRGLSMKRSLQQFLQKRKNRAQAASPYHH